MDHQAARRLSFLLDDEESAKPTRRSPAGMSMSNGGPLSVTVYRAQICLSFKIPNSIGAHSLSIMARPTIVDHLDQLSRVKTKPQSAHNISQESNKGRLLVS
jgi:hypothetical protein